METREGLSFLTIRDINNRIRMGDVKPSELVEAFLQRIHALEPRLKAFITVMENDALRRARDIEARLKRTQAEKTPAILAAPISVKDNINTKGVRTTAGSKIERSKMPDHDATLVSRLKRAGAILLGKNNMSEYAFGITGANPFYGDPANPWDLNRAAGGSSSGSAVAVAASLSVASIGTDSGGSVRVPASLCGVVGFKPTYGRISLHGVKPLSWTLDHVGIIAKTTWDAAAVYETIAGFDPADPRTTRRPTGKITAFLDEGIDPARTRIGYEKSFFQSMCSSAILSRFEDSLRIFEKMGAELVEVEIPMMRYSRFLTLFIMTAEMAAYHGKYVKENPDMYGEHFRKRVLQGMLIPAVDYLKAQQARESLYREFVDRVFKKERARFFLTPTTPITAPEAGRWTYTLEDGREEHVLNLLPRYTSAFNLLGLPAISIPCGFADHGLPAGLQIIGGPYDDASVLAVAQEFEKRVSILPLYRELPRAR